MYFKGNVLVAAPPHPPPHQSGHWNYLDSFLRPDAFVSLLETGLSTPGPMRGVSQETLCGTGRGARVGGKGVTFPLCPPFP